VWQHASRGDGFRPQFWCFDCFHGTIFLEEGGKYVPNGTGFLVSVEVENDRFYSHHQSKHVVMSFILSLTSMSYKKLEWRILSLLMVNKEINQL